MLRRWIVPTGLTAIFLFLLHERLATFELSVVLDGLVRIETRQWFLAIVATAVSFAAVGRYDSVIHRHLQTGIDARSARRAGAGAIAISQVLGAGLVTGALVRWRMLPNLDLRQASRVSVYVTFLFLACLAVVTSICILALPTDAGLLRSPPLRHAASGILLVAALTWAAAVFLRCGAIPDARSLATLLVLTAVDTIAAGAVLWILLPDASSVAFSTLLPTFLMALAAGLFLAAPGGIGAFELTLLGLLPIVPQSDLLPAVLAYRVVYYALPAVVAAIVVVLMPQAKAQSVPGRIIPSRHALADQGIVSLLDHASRAESGLARLGSHELLIASSRQNAWLVGRAGPALVALFDPFRSRDDVPIMVETLNTSARSEGRFACLYKCSARTAVTVRKAGFRIVPVADEAWIAPADWDISRPALSGLRRKLRKAAMAGITIRTVDDGKLPIGDMTAISAAWTRRRGRERGFSMGRFAADYVRRQRVYLAESGGEIIAFATFHTVAGEWTLDLMRAVDGVPDGTMHLLIATAIKDARTAKVRRLSLAAIPVAPGSLNGLQAAIFRCIGRSRTVAGLVRFKLSFDPKRQRLFAAARTYPSLALSLAAIAWTIRHPEKRFAQSLSVAAIETPNRRQ